MSDINSEMKAAADYAIRSAKEKFGQELDYSDQSIEVLENLLEQAYQSFFNLTKDEKTSKAISRTANIWGSYLGEFMRLKWGGAWIQKGSERLVFIQNIEYSPIRFAYQKITSHLEYSVEKYLMEAERKIHPLPITPALSQSLPENISQTKKQNLINQPQKKVTIDKTLIYILAGIGGFLLVIVVCLLGYMIFKSGIISAFGLDNSSINSNTSISVEETLVTATPYPTYTQNPTVTPYPTYTPIATYTIIPSYTPYPTYTQLATLIPTETQKPIVPTRTQAPIPSPTSIPDNPTDKPNHPTQPPIPTQWYPEPTATSSVPIYASCWTHPSTVPVWDIGPLTVYGALQQNGQYIHVSGVNAEWKPGFYFGHCSSSQGNDGPVSCEGGTYFGMPYGQCQTVEVTIIGRDHQFNCQTAYCTP